MRVRSTRGTEPLAWPERHRYYICLRTPNRALNTPGSSCGNMHNSGGALSTPAVMAGHDTDRPARARVVPHLLPLSSSVLRSPTLFLGLSLLMSFSEARLCAVPDPIRIRSTVQV